MTALLVIGSLGLAIIAIPITSQVTAGPTMMGLACLLGILARVQQAADHHPRPKAALLQCRNCGHQQYPGPAACEECHTPFKR
jgi:hypothetical protein